MTATAPQGRGVSEHVGRDSTERERRVFGSIPLSRGGKVRHCWTLEFSATCGKLYGPKRLQTGEGENFGSFEARGLVRLGD